MAVQAGEPFKVEGLGDGVATDFSAGTMVFYENADVFVTHVDASGAETLLSEGTGASNYSVALTAVGVGSTGFNAVITYPADEVTPMASGEKIVIKRVLSFEQELDVENQGGYFPDLVERQLDYLTYLHGQQQEELDRTVKVTIGDDTDPDDLVESIVNAEANASASATAAASSADEAAASAASISLDTLRTDIGAYPLGTVVMVRTANGGNSPSTDPASWKVYAPAADDPSSWVEVDISASTTSGLQEAIDHAARYGYDLKVYGSGIKPEKWDVPYGGALGTDPFATTNGSAVVTVSHTAHGLSTGDKVTFNGLSGAVNGIPQAEFEAEEAITVVNSNSYTITLTTNATSTGSGGGANVRFQHSGQNVGIIHCTSGIDVPPLQGVKWDIHATINFGAGVSVGIDFDSIMASTIQLHDQIVIPASAGVIGVRFKPQSELPQDPNGPIITSSRIELPSVVINGGGQGAPIELDASSGGISSNFFDFIEPNEGSIGVKVQVGASTTFDGNHIKVTDCHGQDTCIDAGTATTNATNIFSNFWDVQCDPASSGVGVEIYGVDDVWRIAVTDNEGTPTNGVTLNSSADRNIIQMARDDASTKINDQATNKSNTIITPRTMIRAHKDGNNQTGVVTATWTDVTFGTEVLDTLGEFDGTTFTATWPGTYMIRARVGWAALGDADLMGVRLLKDGTENIPTYEYHSGTSNNQGPNLCLPVELGEGGTIKIQARQDSGGNASILGDSENTQVSIARMF